jgi:hypothetical protein
MPLSEKIGFRKQK